MGSRKRRRSRAACVRLLLISALMSYAGSSRADSFHRLHWHSDWRRVGGAEYALTTGLFATFLGFWFLPPLDDALWTEPLGFDEGTRNLLRAGTRRGRNVAGTISDAIAGVSYLPPLWIDPMIVSGIQDKNPDVAWQLLVISTQSYALTITLNEISKRVFARERPYAFACAKDPNYSSDCSNADRFRSFYSGHSAVTATSAGLICAHHTHVPLYGGGIADRGACVAALGGAFATGTLRMIADKHWHTDVLTGYVLGLTVGYLLPTLIYYRGFRNNPEPNPPRTGQFEAPLVSAQFTF